MKKILTVLTATICILTSCTEKQSDETEQNSGYYHKILAMEFTSVNCTYCPMLAESLEKLQNNYPERIAAIAFHSDRMGPDPMTLSLSDKIYEKMDTGSGGLPLFGLDFRKSTQHIVSEYDKMEAELKAVIEDHKPSCGIAISSSYDEATHNLKVNASFRSDRTAAYRYHIFLTEDLIEDNQAGHEGNDPYIHNNVLREISSDNIYGTRLEQGKELEAGKEYTVEKTFVIPEEWKSENMRIVVSIMKAAEGSAHVCDNSNECRLGEEVGYLYEKQI